MFGSLTIKHNEDGTYTVTVDGTVYEIEDSYELAHFLDDIGA